MFRTMLILLCVAKHDGMLLSPKYGHKPTHIGHPLPDFYLQNSCKFAGASALAQRPVARQRSCSTQDRLPSAHLNAWCEIP